MLTEYWDCIGQLLYLSQTVAAGLYGAWIYVPRRRLLAAEEKKKKKEEGRPKRRRSRGRSCCLCAYTSHPSNPEGADERMDSAKRKEGES
jgi:hypothetical protein